MKHGTFGKMMGIGYRNNQLRFKARGKGKYVYYNMSDKTLAHAFVDAMHNPEVMMSDKPEYADMTNVYREMGITYMPSGYDANMIKQVGEMWVVLARYFYPLEEYLPNIADNYFVFNPVEWHKNRDEMQKCIDEKVKELGNYDRQKRLEKEQANAEVGTTKSQDKLQINNEAASGAQQNDGQQNDGQQNDGQQNDGESSPVFQSKSEQTNVQVAILTAQVSCDSQESKKSMTRKFSVNSHHHH